MPKIKVDHNKCIACGTCYSLYPACFQEGPEGKSQVKDHDYQKHGYHKDEIINSCPAEAISIED